ncbi:hypothetical protein [Streptomyces hokutonensis]|uniref:hypothetical protein n=1 Tax=Streptomyces hokutonensis TaxID=1306990 RepID=UPI0038153D53
MISGPPPSARHPGRRHPHRLVHRSRQLHHYLLAYAISLWGESGTEDKFKVFLNLTAYFIAPFAVVLLLDFYLGGRSDPSRVAELYDRRRVLDWGFVAWAGGVAASVPFWQSSFYTGPFSSAYPGAGDPEHVRRGRGGRGSVSADVPTQAAVGAGPLRGFVRADVHEASAAVS